MGSLERGEEKKERERELSHENSHSLVCSQNEGLNVHQRRANQLCTGPFLHWSHSGRRVTAKSRRQEAAAILAPEMASSTSL